MKESKYVEFFQMVEEDLTSFVKAAYRDYGTYIEAILALLMAYLFFKLGRALNIDSTLKKITVLNSFQQSKTRLSEKEIKVKETVHRLKTTLKFVAVLLLIANIVIYVFTKEVNLTLVKYRIPPLISLSQKIAVSSLCILLLTFSWILLGRYEKYIAFKTKKEISNLQTIEYKEIDSLMQILGKQALRKIKNRLCKQLIIKLAKENDRYTCRKDKCILERKLLTDSFDIHVRFIKRALQFKWCDVCVSRKKGDKYEAKPYVETGKVYDSQQAQVQDRLNMLYNETNKIVNFIDQLCHNNCNGRYWKLSKQIGQIYKLERGENKKKLDQLQATKPKPVLRESLPTKQTRQVTSIDNLEEPDQNLVPPK